MTGEAVTGLLCDEMFADGAATGKQADDARARLNVLRGQLDALLSTLGKNRSSISENASALQYEREEVEEQLRKRLEEAETLQRSYSGRIETLRDSIAELRQRNDISETRTEKAGTWWRWLLGGMAGGAAIIISLKKIPYTKPIMFWL